MQAPETEKSFSLMHESRGFFIVVVSTLKLLLWQLKHVIFWLLQKDLYFSDWLQLTVLGRLETLVQLVGHLQRVLSCAMLPKSREYVFRLDTF